MHSPDHGGSCDTLKALSKTSELTIITAESGTPQNDEFPNRPSEQCTEPCTPSLGGLPLELQEMIFHLILPDEDSIRIRDLLALSDVERRIHCAMASYVKLLIEVSKREYERLQELSRRTTLTQSERDAASARNKPLSRYIMILECWEAIKGNAFKRSRQRVIEEAKTVWREAARLREQCPNPDA
jgi:hypothetical protein